MQLNIYPDYAQLARATADLIANYVRHKPVSLICLASGHTPLGAFKNLVNDVFEHKLTFDQCTFVGLDEWVGMNGKDEGSCRHMMDEAFFGPLKIPAHQIHFFDGRANNLNAEVDRINQLIDQAGPLDIMLVGIGTNGHVAMNEPGTPFSQMAHISTLAEETKSVGQKYFTGATALDKGLTLGLHHFATATLPLLMANGARKAAIIQRILTEQPGEHLPASIVQQIDRAVVLLDREAGALLP